MPTEFITNSLEVINTEINEIIKLLNGLHLHKASAPDSIHAKFLKETSSEIASALAVIYQASQ